MTSRKIIKKRKDVTYSGYVNSDLNPSGDNEKLVEWFTYLSIKFILIPFVLKNKYISFRYKPI